MRKYIRVFLFYGVACALLAGCDDNSAAANTNADSRSNQQQIEDVASRLSLAPVDEAQGLDAVGVFSLSNALEKAKPLIELQ